MVIFLIPCATRYIFTWRLTVRDNSGSVAFVEVCALLCAILVYADFSAYHYFLRHCVTLPLEGLPMEWCSQSIHPSVCLVWVSKSRTEDAETSDLVEIYFYFVHKTDSIIFGLDGPEVKATWTSWIFKWTPYCFTPFTGIECSYVEGG